MSGEPLAPQETLTATLLRTAKGVLESVPEGFGAHEHNGGLTHDMIELHFRQRVDKDHCCGGVSLEPVSGKPGMVQLAFTVADKVDVQAFMPSALAAPILEELLDSMRAKIGGENVSVRRGGLREWHDRGASGQITMIEFDAKFLDKAHEAVMELAHQHDVRFSSTNEREAHARVAPF